MEALAPSGPRATIATGFGRIGGRAGCVHLPLPDSRGRGRLAVDVRDLLVDPVTRPARGDDRLQALVAAANLIPGPTSTEVAIHVGMRAGWAGVLIAGVCFILPATLLVGVLAWVYEQYGSRPDDLRSSELPLSPGRPHGASPASGRGRPNK